MPSSSIFLSTFVGLLSLSSLLQESVAILGTLPPSLCTINHTLIGDETEVSIKVTNSALNSDGYYQVNFIEGQFVNVTDAKTWCVDVNRSISAGFSYRADTFSSYGNDTALLEYGAVDKPQFLPAVNYLMNEHPVGSVINVPGCVNNNITDHEFQVAVWTLIDASPYPHLLVEGEVQCVVDFLVEVGYNNPSYEPNCTDPDAVIGVLQVVDNWFGEILYQVLISEILLSQTEACECYDGGGAKTEPPTGAPTLAPTPSGVNGDPHFKTFSGEKYDFHGLCDLVLLQNTNFRSGLGMDIHVRSKKWKQWSFISTAVIRIGIETFEVSGKEDGDTFWINHVEGNDDKDWLDDEEKPSIAGYPISYRKPHRFQREYAIKLHTQEYISIKVWKSFVRVDIQGGSMEDFTRSVGLMGSFPEGNKVSRDGKTILEDNNKFGQEWQVLPADGLLFHSADGPQHPSKCQIPTTTALRRKLSESSISEGEAEAACAHVSVEERDLCIFDVMASDNTDFAGAY